MTGTFPHLLNELLERRFDGDAAAFLVAVDPPADEAALAALERVRAGEIAPAWSTAERWCDGLGLSGSERRRFLDLAWLAILPEAVRPRVADLLERLDSAERRVVELERDVALMARDDGIGLGSPDDLD